MFYPLRQKGQGYNKLGLYFKMVTSPAPGFHSTVIVSTQEPAASPAHMGGFIVAYVWTDISPWVAFSRYQESDFWQVLKDIVPASSNKASLPVSQDYFLSNKVWISGLREGRLFRGHLISALEY